MWPGYGAWGARGVQEGCFPGGLAGSEGSGPRPDALSPREPDGRSGAESRGV